MPAIADRVPRTFDEALETERRALLAAVEGAAGPADREGFVALLLARLMFARFLVERGFDAPPLPPSWLRVPDAAVKRLSAFFDRYRWRLDDEVPAAADEITPDVLGRLCERHARRRQTGTYYTADDVSEYIARSTVVPFLLDAAAVRCPRAPDRYAFEPGRRAGAVGDVNDLITHNLDVRRFAADVIAAAGPALLRAIWAALRQVAVLDPTCGSGAFLLAALAVLEPLYLACLDRMEALRRKGADFAATLETVNNYPSRRFFVRQSVLVNNLYGVDLREEAAEACRLRLLLKLAAEARAGTDVGSLSRAAANVRVGDALAATFDWRREFPEVMVRGGFDVIVGNPPYVETAERGEDYRAYATRRCGNLYALVVERSFALLRPQGRAGMIVPHSAFCTDRMAPLMRLFGGRTTWVSTYDIRPSKLFAGVDQRLAIFLTAPSERPQTFGTRYHRWHDSERAALFRTLRYADVSGVEYPNALAKMGCETELRLWQKLRRREPLVAGLGGRATVYYHNAPRYWVRAMTFAPYFRNDRDGEKLSAQVKRLPVRDRVDAGAVAAALNGSLFYWWFVAFSDSRHLNRREIDRFPLGLAEMSDGARRELGALCARLMDDYRRHAVRKECRYKTTGRVVYDEYYPRHSKGIIDDIDRVLARHFGLDEQELDFVITFDVKYRMGPEEEG
jgi:hypothetical protein